MCVMMSLIAAKSDYIIKADQVYANLQKAEEDFEAEAYVIDTFKCMLARREEITDFYTNGISVSVYQTTNGYELCYLNYILDVTVYEERIVDFSLHS